MFHLNVYDLIVCRYTTTWVVKHEPVAQNEPRPECESAQDPICHRELMFVRPSPFIFHRNPARTDKCCEKRDRVEFTVNRKSSTELAHRPGNNKWVTVCDDSSLMAWERRWRKNALLSGADRDYSEPELGLRVKPLSAPPVVTQGLALTRTSICFAASKWTR